jgi:hypothetical protein
MEQYKKNLNTAVNCNVLKLMLIAISKTFFIFIINSPYLPLLHPVYVCMYVCMCLVMSPLVSSFVLWSHNVCPQTDLRNFISTLSFRVACPFNKAQLSHPYRSCGATIAFCNFNIPLLLPVLCVLH